MVMRGKSLYFAFHLVGLLSLTSCGLKDPLPDLGSSSCAPTSLLRLAGSTGVAKAFITDPISSSGDANLLPTTGELDQYASEVSISHLSGLGVLDGQYVSIRNRVQCSDHFGAFDLKNQFVYPHSDFRFQEAMSYYFGDLYQDRLKGNGYLVSRDPVVILAHCESVDNSYFTKAHDTSGQIYSGREFNEVCLGDSNYSPGAFYADDAQVVIHELQHAATIDNYSAEANLNQFFYDEAGDINEGISDFMSLAFSDNLVPASGATDPRLFSRWALGTFNSKPNHSGVRGAHRCPMYDASFPDCSSYPSFALPSERNGNTATVSYVYPDGLGWPFPNNYKNHNVLSRIYQSYAYDEEIHNNDLIVMGALWDVYAALKQNRRGDGWAAFNLTQKLVLESVRHLPFPTPQNRSPVTFIQLASKMVDSIPLISDLNAADRASIQQALKDRGLYQMPTIQARSWASVGAGTFKFRPNTATPGVFVQDNPDILKKWLTQMGLDSSVITHGLATGSNSMLDPGEIAVIWFDLENNDDLTAGGVLLTVSSSDPDVEILDDTYNVGFTGRRSRNEAQVMYYKINGKTMGGILNPILGSSPPQGFSFSTQGNTYFTTDPLFGFSYRTGLWVRVHPAAQHGKEVEFQVQAVPSNGSEQVQNDPVSLRFPVTIQ